MGSRVAETVWLAFYLLGWYGCNSFFSVLNKQVLTQWPYPWVVSWIQLFTGVAYVVPMWALGLRQVPKVDQWLVTKFAPIGALHASGHALQVSAMGAGSVFMVNVVKAAEPIVGSVVAFVAEGKVAGWLSNASLVPIVAGVTIAGLKPGATVDPFADLRSFVTAAALGSSVFFSVAKLLAKKLMTRDLRETRHLDAANNYALLTCASCAALFAPALLLEARAAVRDAPTLQVLKLTVLSGALYYTSNEFSFRVLNLLGPVPQAVANAAKRVFVFVSAVVFLGETVTHRKLLGSAIALSGVLAYGLARNAEAQHHKEGAAKKQK